MDFVMILETWKERRTFLWKSFVISMMDRNWDYMHNIRMKIKDDVSYMKVQHGEDPLYIFDEKFGEAALELLKDYNVPNMFKEDFFDVLDMDQRPPFRWLIMGLERSGASLTTKDAGKQIVIQCLEAPLKLKTSFSILHSRFTSFSMYQLRTEKTYFLLGRYVCTLQEPIGWLCGSWKGGRYCKENGSLEAMMRQTFTT